MDASEVATVPRRRWPLPTTFGGLAALAEGPAWRLAAWQVFFAGASALALVWAMEVTWGHAFERAAAALPEQASISDGRLHWPSGEMRVLQESSFLAIVVDPKGDREAGYASDATLSIEAEGLGLRSVLGWAELRYPPNLRLGLSRSEMAGAIEAWRGPVQLTAAVLVTVGLLACWWTLGWMYSVVLWILGGVLSRPIGFGRLWRLAAGAPLPGALLMSAAVALYATHALSLVGLLVALPAHFVIAWVYCAGGWGRLESAGKRGPNPFSHDPPAPPLGAPRPANPFRTS